jgi:hypothetical protein
MSFAKPYAQLINEALVHRAKAAYFPKVTYEGGNMLIGDPLECANVRTNALSANWDEPRRNRQRGYIRERNDWQWELIIRFAAEVNTEAFEASMEQNPPSIIRDADHDRQVDLLITSARYINPPQNQPNTGTEVIYTVIARLTLV